MFEKIFNNKKQLYLLLAFLVFFVAIIVVIVYIKVVNIYVVFNTDRNYKEYTKVALKSAIENKNPYSVYNIKILCVDLTEKERDEFKDFEARRVKISTVPLKLDSIKNIGKHKIDHYVSRADLFKFFMPEIFPELNKILYIDSDTIILHDLSKLYHTNISRYPLAAVKKNDASVEWEKNEDGSMRVNRIYSYNCGVLLFNLKNMRDNFLTTELIISKNKDKKSKLVTQNSFNDVIPINTIKLLSPIYNTYSRWSSSDFDNWDFKEIYSPFLDNIIDMNDLREHAVIVHFAGAQKPWFNNEIYFADLWWKYARMVNPNWQLETKK